MGGISRIAVMFALCTVVVAGCARTPSGEAPDGSGDAATPSESSSQETMRKGDVRALVTVEVKGAQEFSWEGEQVVRVMRAGAPGVGVNLLSVGMVTPQQLDDPRSSFRWAFDLLDVYVDETGTYTLPATDPTKSTAQSAALLYFLRAKEGAPLPPQTEEDLETFLQFQKVVQPCTVTVDAPREQSGSITCPDLQTSEGEGVSLRATWELLEPVEGAS